MRSIRKSHSIAWGSCAPQTFSMYVSCKESVCEHCVLNPKVSGGISIYQMENLAQTDCIEGQHSLNKIFSPLQSEIVSIIYSHWVTGLITWLGFTNIKGTVSRDFLLLVFFMNQFPPSPRVSHQDCFKFFQKYMEIFASQGAPPVSTTALANWPPVSMTPVANFATNFASVVVNNTSGKFAAGVNNIGGNLPPVSTTTAANLPQVSMTPVANNGTKIRLLKP